MATQGCQEVPGIFPTFFISFPVRQKLTGDYPRPAGSVPGKPPYSGGIRPAAAALAVPAKTPRSAVLQKSAAATRASTDD